MKLNLTFIIFTVLIITSCSSSKDSEQIENEWSTSSVVEKTTDQVNKLKAKWGIADDELQWTHSVVETNF